MRPWKGAEFWVDPEIDQGHGLAETHGVAGFPSGEAYKLGADYPYARVQRYFLRQTIDLGGDTQKVDADINQFADRQTANRLVLTVGKFAIVDIFDTNKYANNPKTDFLNWSLINAGTFDYAGDAWGYSYGAAAEWYQGRFTLRGGVFDMSATPRRRRRQRARLRSRLEAFTNSSMSAKSRNATNCGASPASSRSPAFSSTADGEVPGCDQSGCAARPAVRRRRQRRARGGAHLSGSGPASASTWSNKSTTAVGVFARAGWADGNVEPWDFTDIDRTVQAGVSIDGKQWGRPDDTIGIAGVVNGLAPVHQAYFNAGGIGILIGDGQLTNYGLEQIFEAYYSYAHYADDES